MVRSSRDVRSVRPPPLGLCGLFRVHWWSAGLILAPRYPFIIHSIKEGLPARPGVYIIAKPAKYPTKYVALYIGRAEDIADRFSGGHGKMSAARSFGATTIHVYQVDSEVERKQIEGTLIDFYKPPLNIQQPRASLLTGRRIE